MNNLHLRLTQICLLRRLRVSRLGVMIPSPWEASVPLTLAAWMSGGRGMSGRARVTQNPISMQIPQYAPLQAGVMGDIKRVWVTWRTLNLIIQVALTHGHTYVCAWVHEITVDMKNKFLFRIWDFFLHYKGIYVIHSLRIFGQKCIETFFNNRFFHHCWMSKCKMANPFWFNDLV